MIKSEKCAGYMSNAGVSGKQALVEWKTAGTLAR
jgi:hypothetical protein